MATVTKVLRNFYRDSVSLMQLSSTSGKLSGVERASAMMASVNNLRLLQEVGLLTEPVEASAKDLPIALQGEAAALESALATAESALKQPSPSSTGKEQSRGISPCSIEMGLGNLVGANLALISTPGEYAAAEAFKALRPGLNVMLFSDNVDLKDEIALNGSPRNVISFVMGPDCGTAIIVT